MTLTNRTWLIPALALLALLTTRLVAQEHHETPPEHGKAPHTQATDTHAATAGEAHGAGHAGGAHDTGPIPPEPKLLWPGVVLIVIAAMFVLAAVIGPLSRMHAPPADMPPTHSHDEPPGASHHHGASGTINPEPDHGHASGHGHH